MLDQEYYAAKASGDPARFAEAKAKCLAAGYELTPTGHLIETGRVKGAPAAVSKTEAAAIFGGDSKGIARKPGAAK